jgi:dCMP deaminase
VRNHEYFIEVARAVAIRSKDPSSKVGALLVDQDNVIVSTGYNGFVAGCDESKLSWERPAKYLYIIHAELNALIYSRRDLSGCRAYVTHGPCENCLKHLLQARVTEVWYSDASIMRDRGTDEQKNAISNLIQATGARVKNINGKDYIYELREKV